MLVQLGAKLLLSSFQRREALQHITGELLHLGCTPCHGSINVPELLREVTNQGGHPLIHGASHLPYTGKQCSGVWRSNMHVLDVMHRVYIVHIVLHVGHDQRTWGRARGQYTCSRCCGTLRTVKHITINLLHGSRVGSTRCRECKWLSAHINRHTGQLHRVFRAYIRHI